MTWVIEYYTTRAGRSPVAEFIESLSPEGKAKYILIADLLEQYGIQVREPHVKPITGRRKLFEIRIKDKKLVLLHGFTKKTEKTPAREIATAVTWMEDYLSRRP